MNTAPPTVEARTLPEFARKSVFAIAGSLAAVLLATSWRYGYFGDELYFLSAGNYHLSVGYADQPWLVPLLAQAIDTIFPDSLVALRIPSLILMVLGVVVTALVARELGGGRRAQALASGAYAISPQLLGSAHMLSTATLDVVGWTVVTWLVVRWVRLRQDRLLLFAGVVTAIDLQVKFLIPFFWIAAAAAALVIGPRSLLTRPTLWAGAGISLAATTPTLIWQHTHDWPYFHSQTIVSQQAEMLGGRVGFVPLAVLFAGVLVGAVLVVHGLWHLLRSPDLAPYRFLGWAVLLATVIFVIINGKYYYVAGFYGLLFAVSAVRIEQHGIARWWRWVPTRPVYAVSAAFAVFLALPVLPPSTVNANNFVAAASLGWPKMANTVMDSYQSLPPNTRPDAVVTQTAWQASALEVYGKEQLPSVYSPERGYWYFGRPSTDTDSVLFVGWSPESMRHFFGTVERVGGMPADSETPHVNTGVQVWLCESPRVPLARVWDDLHVW